MYVEIPWEFEKQITSLTICFWIKNSANPEMSFDGELLAIFDKDESKKILSISGNKKQIALFLTLEKGIQFEFWISAFLSNQWNEICSTISSSEAVAALYVNGEAVGAEVNHKLKSFVIPDTINIVVGEKQNCNLEECNFFNNFHGSMYGLNMWDISLSEKEITNNYEKQNTDCECILGNIMSFTPWSNSNDISRSKNDTLKIFGRAAVSAFYQAEGNIEIFGISNSCLILISEEETTSFVPVNNRFTQNTNSKSSMINIIVPLCCAIAIIIILACFILWFLCCKRQNKQNIVLQSDAKITEYVDLPPETTKASRNKVIKNKYVDENNKPKTRQRRNDLPGVKSHINLFLDPHHRPRNDSPTFSRKQSTIHREHIYEEIHPKYVPSILKNCSIKERNRPGVETIEENADIFSTQVYYSMPPEDNSRPPMNSLYELPLESTFINSLATGDIH
uniref:uncharacterized protein LOC120342901 n=1 Tax=Styela clava TaxID=7725 RepID=UPI0019397952|nr:uncharacterized protein LOC120342901 [Styela clava]